VKTVRKFEECGHTYHEDCITKWMQQKAECPLCRRPQSTTSSDSDSGEELDRLFSS